MKYRFSSPFSLWDLVGLNALRIWPEDGQLQIEYFRHCYRSFEVDIENEISDLEKRQDILMYLKTIRVALGGREALYKIKDQESFDKEIEKRTLQGEWAGLILSIAFILYSTGRSDLISWNRIIDFIERDSHLPGWKPTYRTALVDSWRRYETVAHIWAAHMYLGGFWHKGTSWPECSIQEDVEYRLAYSKTFQNFGLSFRPRNSKKTFLNDKILHKIDLPFQGEMDWKNLPAEWLDSLEDF